MIIRDLNGKLIIINKKDFTNDKNYYRKIFDIKNKISKVDNIQPNYSNLIQQSNFSNVILQKYIL